MKFKNLLIITISILLLTLITTLVLGFVNSESVELVKRTISSYKICVGLTYFCDVLPSILGTAFLLGWAFDFGENYQGSRERFSSSMLTRYKYLLISALCIVFVLTMSSEIVLPILKQKIQTYIEMPKLEDEYKKYARNLYETERYDLAREFAHLAVEIDPSDKEAIEIMDKSEIAAKKIETVHTKNNVIDMSEIIPSTTDLSVNPGDTSKGNTISEPYNLLLKAEDAYEKGEWFNAHFYAETALSITNERDVNYSKLKQTSSAAWNEISKSRFSGTTAEQKIFAKKYEGYRALLEKDNLHAYYVFKHLYETEKLLSLDPDIIRYLDIAEKRLEKQYFFTDETISLQNFETAKNIRFKINHKDGTSDIYFIKGVTSTGKKATLTQYLRGLSIFTVDEDGNYLRGSYTPYAKMKEISASYFDEYAKKQLELDESLKTVPYITLNSVDRRREGVVNSAIPIKGENNGAEGYIILPIEFKEFFLLKDISSGISNLSLNSAMKFVKISEKYGFAKEIYLITIFNRLLYPLFILILLIGIGIGAWHGRLPPNSVFKFKWIVIFPLFTLLFYAIYRFTFFGFKLLNCSILGLAGSAYAIPVGCIIYALIFAAFSISFCACKNSMSQRR